MLTVDLLNLTSCETVDLCLVVLPVDDTVEVAVKFDGDSLTEIAGVDHDSSRAERSVQKRSLLRRAKPEHHLCQRLTVVSLSSSASELELWRLGEGDVASVVKIAHVLYADTAPVRQVNSRFDGQDHTIKQGIFGRPADPG